MAEERISSVVAPSAFDEVKRLGDDIVALEKKANAVDIRIEGGKSISELSLYLKELAANTEAVTAAVEAQDTARKKAVSTEKQDLKFQKELETQGKANAKMLLDLEKAKQREHKLNQEASSDYKILSKAYQDAALRAKDYNLQLGAQHPLTVQATADALAMGNRLKEVDASVGQFQRNVGNYNMVGSQFNQLLRELPNAGISARTFIMAISNNITYFAEAVKDARGQGQSWGSVLKTMGGSLFGLVGIINLAVTAFTFIAMAMEKSSRETKELEDNTDNLTEAYVRNIEALQKRRDLFNVYNKGQKDNEAALKREIDLMKARGDDEVAIFEKQQEYTKLRKKNLADEKTAIEGLIYATNTLFERQANRSNPLKYAEQNKEVVNDLIGVIQRQTNVTKEEARKQAEAIVKEYRNNNNIIISLEEERAKRAVEISDLEAQLQINNYEFQRGLKEEIKKDDEKYQKEKEKAYKEHMARMRAYEKANPLTQMPTSTAISFNNRTDEFRESAAEIENANLNLLTRIEEQYATGVINAEEYEQAKVNAAHTANREKLRIELEYTKSVIDLIYNPEERTKALQRINEIELEIIRIGNAEKLAEYQKDVKSREEAEREANKKIAEQRKQLQFILQQIQTTITALAGIQSDKLQARISQLQKEGQLIEANGKREIERIQNSTLTAAEKQKLIREEEAKTESQRIANEARQREAARRKAAFDKAANISNIITTGALAVVNAYYENGPIGAAIAGVAVAAQLARAASAPLPQYEGGTLDHKGGKFIAGEKESELVIRPDGRAYWTKDTATVYDEPKHTKVFNQEQINRIAMASLNPAMIAALKPRRDEDFTKHIVNAVEKTGRNTVRAIAQNRANVNVHQQTMDFYYLSKVKGKA